MLQSELELLVDRAANNYVKMLRMLGEKLLERNAEEGAKGIFIDGMINTVRGSRKEEALAFLRQLAEKVPFMGRVEFSIGEWRDDGESVGNLLTVMVQADYLMEGLERNN